MALYVIAVSYVYTKTGLFLTMASWLGIAFALHYMMEVYITQKDWAILFPEGGTAAPQKVLFSEYSNQHTGGMWGYELRVNLGTSPLGVTAACSRT